ncbi:transposase [Pseudomonas fluorescens]|uniref:transposase n=1 Tax=Pseudomonas fluorescens TaxID=294 RepID=UPI000F46BB4A
MEQRTSRHRLLHDDQWERSKNLLPGKAHDRGVTARDNRQFVEAVLWNARTGSPWRDLPETYGHWRRVYVRYSRWSRKDVWVQMMDALAAGADLEHLMWMAASCEFIITARQKKQSRTSRLWASPEGIHAAVDALDNPVSSRSDSRLR